MSLVGLNIFIQIILNNLAQIFLALTRLLRLLSDVINTLRRTLKTSVGAKIPDQTTPLPSRTEAELERFEAKKKIALTIGKALVIIK